MTENDKQILVKIATLFPVKACTNLIRTDEKFRNEFEDWYKKKYGKEYDWKQGVLCQ